MSANFFAKKSVLITWQLICAILAIVFYGQFIKQANINSDISSILPIENQEAAKLGKLFNQTTANQIIWMLKAHDELILVEEAKKISAYLAASSYMSEIRGDSKSLSLLFDILAQNPGIYLSKQDKSLLENKDYRRITQRKTEQLFSPISAVNSELLIRDPLLLTTSYLQQSFENNKAKSMGSFIGYQEKDNVYLLMNLELIGSPFDIELQKQYLSYVDDISSKLSDKGIELLQLGVIGFAAYETQQGLKEAKIIGLGSILVIFILISLIFRSSVPLFLMSLVIVTGIICALAIASLVFGQLHVLSILVGTSLIGIAVDYVFHYFAKNTFYNNKDAARRILKPVTLGLVTSILGYSALFLSSLEVLQQIAFISSIGLVAAYLSTMILLPAFSFDLSKSFNQNFPFFTRLNEIKNRKAYKKSSLFICIAVLLSSLFLLPKISFNDNVELLHASPKHLVDQQNTIESLVKEAAPGTNLIFEAESREQLLIELEKFDTLLQQEVSNGNIESYIGLQQFLRSKEHQAHSKGLVQAWLNSDDIHQYLSVLDLDVSKLKASLDSSKLEQIDFIGTTYQPLIEKLLIETKDGHFYGLVKLMGAKDLSTINGYVDNHSTISIIDHKTVFSNFLSEVRQDSIYFVTAAYLIILMLLILTNGLKPALRQFIPPLTAALLGLFAAVALGQMINIFHIVALTLVLGIGIDYTIFYTNAKQHKSPDMVLAISCSMISTVLAFGLMALSQTPAVAGFGTVILVGILSAYLLAPLAKES